MVKEAHFSSVHQTSPVSLLFNSPALMVTNEGSLQSWTPDQRGTLCKLAATT